MTRLEKLQQCLDIARKHKNPDMEANLLIAIQEERDNPSGDTYLDPTEE